jgi:hypothetical protein
MFVRNRECNYINIYTVVLIVVMKLSKYLVKVVNENNILGVRKV